MSKPLILNDIDDSIKDKIYVQSYSPKEIISEVKLIKVNNHVDEEGDFSEILRLNKNGEALCYPGFKVLQINRSMVFPKSIKAWHMHFKQDELWYVSPMDHLIVGLWDLRKKSPTKGKSMKVVLGGGKSQLLYIPKGVAHGSTNHSLNKVTMWYFINQQFDPDNPDEKRLPFNSLDDNFWLPSRD